MNTLLLSLGLSLSLFASASPEQVVQDFWGALKKADQESAYEHLSAKSKKDMDLKKFKKNFNIKELPKDMQKRLVLKKTQAEEVRGSNVVVKTKVERPEFEKLMMVLPQRLMTLAYQNQGQELSPKDMEKILMEESRKLPQTTSDEKVYLVKEGGSWKVDLEKTRGGFALPVLPKSFGQ